MSLLATQLRKLALNRDKHQSAKTRADRVATLLIIARHLATLGYDTLSLLSIEHEHVQALLALWFASPVSPGTLRNRLSVVRWILGHIGKAHLLPPSNESLGIPKRDGPRAMRPHRRRVAPPSPSTDRLCRGCFRPRPLVAMVRDRHKHDGYGTICLDCHRKQNTAYALAHQEEIRAHHAGRKEARRAYDAQHREARRTSDWARRYGLPHDSQALRALLQAPQSLKPQKPSKPKLSLNPPCPPKPPTPYPPTLAAAMPQGAPVLRRGTPIDSAYSKIQRRSPCVYVVQLCERKDTVKIGISHILSERIIQLQQLYGAIQVLMIIPHPKPSHLEKLLHKHFSGMRIYEGGAPSELFFFNTQTKRKAFLKFFGEYPSFCHNPPQWGAYRRDASKEGSQRDLFAEK